MSLAQRGCFDSNLTLFDLELSDHFDSGSIVRFSMDYDIAMDHEFTGYRHILHTGEGALWICESEPVREHDLVGIRGVDRNGYED